MVVSSSLTRVSEIFELGVLAQNSSKNASGAASEISSKISVDPMSIIVSLFVLIAAYVVAKGISILFAAFADRFAENRFRVTMVIPIMKFVVYGSAAYLIVAVLFEFSTTQLVAFSGLLGAALGLGLKDFLADVVGGLVVIFEQPYQVGDKVELGGHYGEIVDIGIRSTKLVTPNDTLVVVPNFLFFNESISNANTSNAEMMVVVEFYVDPDSDIARAREIVEEALATSKYAYVTEEHRVLVRVEDDLYYRTVIGKAYVNDLRNEYSFKTDVTERVLEKFGEEGIKSPKISPGSAAGVDEPSGVQEMD